MSKNLIYKLIVAFVIVAAAVLWLLSVLIPETFGGFNLSWAIAMASAAVGVALVLKGMFRKNTGMLKKLNIYIGAGCLIVTVFAVVSAIALPDNIVMPIIAIVVTVALLLSLLVTGGKKWDQGDNQNVGYKDYYARKKEEEKNNKKDD